MLKSYVKVGGQLHKWFSLHTCSYHPSYTKKFPDSYHKI